MTRSQRCGVRRANEAHYSCRPGMRGTDCCAGASASRPARSTRRSRRALRYDRAARAGSWPPPHNRTADRRAEMAARRAKAKKPSAARPGRGVFDASTRAPLPRAAPSRASVSGLAFVMSVSSKGRCRCASIARVNGAGSCTSSGCTTASRLTSNSTSSCPLRGKTPEQ